MTKIEGCSSAPSTFVLPIMALLLVGSIVLPSFNLSRSQALAAAPITPSGLNTQVNLSLTPPAGAVQYDITGGTRPGGGTNLFHSFGDFNVPTNNIANFLNDSGLATSNILGRVTGGNISNIYGTIQTTGFGNANLFLMNPAGFLFGPNATVNVGGMVAFTSADYLKLTDNARFNTIPNAATDALLTASPVAAFGFLGSNPGAITVQGSQFSLADGQSISLVGGNVTIKSGTLQDGAAQPARLSAPSGKIQLASATSPGEFDATTLQPLPNADGASFTSFGSVTLAPGSTMDLSGINTVSIRGGQFVLSVNDTIMTTAESAPVAGTVTLSPRSVLMTVNAGLDSGAANVKIVAGRVKFDGAFITTDTQGTGAGGNIFVNANTVTLQNDGTLSTATSGTSSAATGGTIMVEANQVQLNNGGLITASTTGTGAGGSITIGAGSTFASNASTVRSTATQAQGGNINITSGQSVTLNNGSLIAASSTGPGNAGNILINAGQNYTSTYSAVDTEAARASGGNIIVLATDTVRLTNSMLTASALGSSTTIGANITIDPQYVILVNSQMLAQARQGQGGAISINITNGGLFLSDENGVVDASAKTFLSLNAPASGHIEPLGNTPLQTTLLLNQHCAALADGKFSSFTVAGRDSLPPEPGSWLTSPLSFGSAGFSSNTVKEGDAQARVIDTAHETTVLSLRQIAPAGFLTQAFAVDWSASCQS